MDTTTASVITNTVFLIFIAFVVWAITRKPRVTDKHLRDLQELVRKLAEATNHVAAARREITLLRDDVGKVRGELGANRGDA